MKSKKFQYQTENKRKKTTQKFKEYNIEDDEAEIDYKRRKDVGMRMHRQKTIKDLFSESDK